PHTRSRHRDLPVLVVRVAVAALRAGSGAAHARRHRDALPAARLDVRLEARRRRRALPAHAALRALRAHGALRPVAPARRVRLAAVARTRAPARYGAARAGAGGGRARVDRRRVLRARAPGEAAGLPPL